MKKPIVKSDELDAQYQSIFGDVSSIIDEAKRTAARSVHTSIGESTSCGL